MMEGSPLLVKCLRAEDYVDKIVDVAAKAQLCEELKLMRATSLTLEADLLQAAKECRARQDQSVDEMYRDIWEEQCSEMAEVGDDLLRQKELFLSSLTSKLKGVLDEHKGGVNNIVSLVGDASSAMPMPVVVSKHFSPPKSSPTGVSRSRGGLGGDKAKKASPAAAPVWGNEMVLEPPGEDTEGRRQLEYDDSERTPSAPPNPSERAIEAPSSLTPVPKPVAATGFTENMTSTAKRSRNGVSDKSEDLMHDVQSEGYNEGTSKSSKQRRASHDRRRDTMHQSQHDIGQIKEFCAQTQQY